MPFFGAHMSIADGLHLAFDRISSVGGEALQIFTRNQRQWQVPELPPEQIALFGQAWHQWGRTRFVAAHTSYLINSASPEHGAAGRAAAMLAVEISRAGQLGIHFLVHHPGSHMGAGIEAGIGMVAATLDQAFAKAAAYPEVTVLLETTAGQGTSLGATFEELAGIIEKCRHPERLGICFDTCHAFAAGHDLRTETAYEKTINNFDRIIGLERLRCFHLNDSKKELGGRVDRHEHIGAGNIGLPGFKLLLNDQRFRDHPMILETPKEKDLLQDIENLAILRRLLKKKPIVPRPVARS